MAAPRRDTIDVSVRAGVDKRHRVDLGLALLECLVKPGASITRYDIAAWCGCTDAAIYQIERRAMLKISNRVRFGERGFFRELKQGKFHLKG